MTYRKTTIGFISMEQACTYFASRGFTRQRAKVLPVVMTRNNGATSDEVIIHKDAPFTFIAEILTQV